MTHSSLFWSVRFILEKYFAEQFWTLVLIYLEIQKLYRKLIFQNFSKIWLIHNRTWPTEESFKVGVLPFIRAYFPSSHLCDRTSLLRLFCSLHSPLWFWWPSWIHESAGEIERTLKKVEEGKDEFKDTMTKVLMFRLYCYWYWHFCTFSFRSVLVCSHTSRSVVHSVPSERVQPDSEREVRERVEEGDQKAPGTSHLPALILGPLLWSRLLCFFINNTPM